MNVNHQAECDGGRREQENESSFSTSEEADCEEADCDAQGGREPQAKFEGDSEVQSKSSCSKVSDSDSSEVKHFSRSISRLRTNTCSEI